MQLRIRLVDIHANDFLEGAIPSTSFYLLMSKVVFVTSYFSVKIMRFSFDKAKEDLPYDPECRAFNLSSFIFLEKSFGGGEIKLIKNWKLEITVLRGGN